MGGTAIVLAGDRWLTETVLGSMPRVWLCAFYELLGDGDWLICDYEHPSLRMKSIASYWLV